MLICARKLFYYENNKAVRAIRRRFIWSSLYSTGAYSARSTQKHRVLFLGTDLYSLYALRPLLAHLTNSDVARISHLGVCSKFAEPGCEVAKQLKLRGTLDNISLVNYSPQRAPVDWDVGVIASFGSLIPPSFIKSFPYGIICIHPSLLPRWRGAAPLMRTILAGDTVSGTTLFHISPEKFDTGPIISQEKRNVPPQVTSHQLGRMLMELGVEMFLDTLKNLPEAVENAVAQPTEGVTYAKKIRQAETFVDWNWPADYIDRFFRALGEDFGVRTMWDDQIVKINGIVEPAIVHKARIDELVSDGSFPGSLFFHKKRDILFVKCRDGWVGITALYMPNRKPMNAKDFYNGFLSPNKNKRLYFEANANCLAKSLKIRAGYKSSN
ncbi:methionyl-tRNA formyltransferase, mitochondrial-like [Paramacrobiotus metropolitanus]|uniref:methionyl-tRNA formyltransferase, mitochondrial-like n=1 Tax=Paramacrobiotus metropolitanus TaxID=2943436 RepID=UPI0024464436|nr:methionyl-tRNA formyltransferase, mitochondrial-like [Paramacrobiotus metropolitanus]